MTDVPIGSKEERRALRAALAARVAVRVTSGARGAAPVLDAAFDALLFALLPSEAPGLPAAALRDFLGISSASREGRVLSDGLQRLRQAGRAQMLADDRDRRHWRGAQDAAPAVPAPHDPHDDVWCFSCGAVIGSCCRGPRGEAMGAHKRRVSDSLALRAERQKERDREAAGAKATASAARRVLTRGIEHSTEPEPGAAPAPWPPHLGEAPWLTAHRRVVVPEVSLRGPRDLDTLVAALLALRPQMFEDEG